MMNPQATPKASLEPRKPCPVPADFRAEVAAYERDARVETWNGPRYRITYRVLGQGPPLILVPGIASTYRSYALLLNRLSARFKTVVYDFPGENRTDSARLRRIGHTDLVDDLFELIEHMRIGRAFLLGISFGSTIVIPALMKEPRRFPRAVLQGGFARRRFSAAERLALRLGRLFPGTTGRLPWRETILAWNNKAEFPTVVADRWPYYVEQNGLTPIASLAHRLDLIARLDLRPVLKEVQSEVLLLQGTEDRIVLHSAFEELCRGLTKATPCLMPLVGHVPHFTQAEAMASTIADYLLPCAPEGCPNERA
jgi:pimeloyl-ACP methyl ester carboxylesterase